MKIKVFSEIHKYQIQIKCFHQFLLLNHYFEQYWDQFKLFFDQSSDGHGTIMEYNENFLYV